MGWWTKSASKARDDENFDQGMNEVFNCGSETIDRGTFGLFVGLCRNFFGSSRKAL
jgi:hypothetical protein